MTKKGHILLVTFPAQGHINPSLQFAEKLIEMGVDVTLSTSLFAHRRMLQGAESTKGLNVASFSDGYDEVGFKTDDVMHFMSALSKSGSNKVKEIIESSAKDGRPVNCVVYTLLLPWAADVAREYHIPSALLWIQAATVLDIYYYYFNGYGEAIDNTNDPSWSIELPGLPLVLHAADLPSFFLPSCKKEESPIPSFKEQFETLNVDTNPIVLVNSFDALETEALKAINKLKLIAIGPVIPSVFSGGKNLLDSTSSGGDLSQKSRNYKDWLDSKPAESVIYISFGSMLVLPKPQREEIGKALLKSGMPFLWVIKEKQGELEKEEKLSCIEDLEKQGMIVPWCSQFEVLSHPSLGCFVTHCGWNSTLESLISGVPMVAFPSWSDQTTNAKLIQDVWKTGVRVTTDELGVDSNEIFRCLEMVVGENELRNNAKKWRGLAMEAINEGGTSDKNLKTFVEEVVGEGFSSFKD